ncbi:MAG: VCBS repeat-containing protein [Fuerstia sp.]|nr:VCBS repeat-containing protein [Fuerstiella sp.]
MTSDLAPIRKAVVVDSGLRVACLIALLIGNLIVLFPLFFPSARARSLSDWRAAIVARQPDVKAKIGKHLAAFPDDPAACFMAAELAAYDHDQPLAIEYFSKLPADGGRWQLQRELGIAKRCRVQGRMLDEEEHLRNVLRLNPTHSDANHRLGHLLQVQGRTWESAEPFMMQLRRGKCRGDELMGVATTERFYREDQDFERTAIESNPAQPGVAVLGSARRMLFENRNEEAEKLLRQVIATAPHLGEAQGRLGRIIVERGAADEFIEWRGSLPDAARNHPEVWFVQGLQARRTGQTEGAIHCFLKAIQLSPNHLPANVQIAGCLESIGESEAAQVFQTRAKLLSELETILNLLRTNIDEQLMIKAADRLAQLGRYWEATGWLYVVSQLDIPDDPARPTPSKWGHLAIQDPDQNSTIAGQIASLGIDRFSEPNWGLQAAGRVRVTPQENMPSGSPVSWMFTDEAAAAGINFTYFEGTTEETRLQHIFNVVGGGMAAFDFDLDGWPDLHIAQANNWRVGDQQPVVLDALYRNLNGTEFKDVASVSNLIEPGFSHGVCAGDFDQDGFPDVSVSNLGANRLFHNNGDGTFEDVTSVADVAGSEWSITSVLADFNDDGLPDLYVGNYSKRDETTNKICHRSTGEEMACTPDVLTAESDRLYLNLGDGRFRDVTDVSQIRETSGRALALIAWDFTGDGRTSLFVANDTSANFLFHNLDTNADGVPEFSEEGVLRGLAFDADGNAQASMGVAAGDANGDGKLDLFVTNFEHESNTFYSQGPDGLYLDFTRQYGLRDPGYGMLGFGTQFADFDGDGWDDLVATNGHVDKRRDSSEKDRMRPQLFRNLQGHSFAEIPPDVLGTFFLNDYLGRGLATLDWNKDGRTDFGVSNLHAPYSLVTNRTPSSSVAVAVRLISTSGVRDGSGATIRARIAGRDHFRLAVEGGGYLTTNEQRFVFYVPNGEMIEQLEVTWSNDNVQSWNVAPATREFVLIKGREAPIEHGDAIGESLTPMR